MMPLMRAARLDVFLLSDRSDAEVVFIHRRSDITRSIWRKRCILPPQPVHASCTNKVMGCKNFAGGRLIVAL